nr:NYN domain-containing protein [uncultured Massilia sp.]
MTTNAKLAVLIDADNAQASVIKELLTEVSTFGTASVKRAYGDWTTTNLRSWKDMLHLMAIQPVQQFSYTTGKNATDSSLIIDAMDLLHSGKLDGFCLVSSDSDFTRLATRIRESGLAVYGFGERKTPPAFVAACDKFVYTEILRPAAPAAAAGKPHKPAQAAAPIALDEETRETVRKAIIAAARDDGFAPLSGVGNLILKNSPAFDPRSYGCDKLGELMRRLPFVDVKEIQSEKAPSMHLYVKLK